MVFGASATLAGGALCDHLFQRTGRPAVYALFPAAVIAASFPFECWMCAGPSFGATVALFLPQTAAANIPSGPVRCLVSALVPARSRATANSVLEARRPFTSHHASPAVLSRRALRAEARAQPLRDPAPAALPSRAAQVAIGMAGGLGPLFVGVVSDALQRDNRHTSADALSRAMLAVQMFSVPAALAFWRAAACAEGDLRRKR